MFWLTESLSLTTALLPPLIGVALGTIAGIVGLASALGGLFSGRGGDETGSALDPETQALMRRLLPQLEAQLQLDRVMGLRGSLLTDPGLASVLGQLPADQYQALGLPEIPLAELAGGGVPLQRAAVNLAFGLLPRWARTSSLEPFALPTAPFGGTPELAALSEAAPLSRYPRQSRRMTIIPPGTLR